MDKKVDLRIKKTYLALYNAFTALLEEKCFEDFTLNELCEKAMIRRTTFYKHFADKYEYFTFYIKEICAQFQDELPTDVATVTVNDYFLLMCRKLLRFIDRHERLVKNVMNSNMAPVLIDSLMEQITNDILMALRSMNTPGKLSVEQLQDIAAFYSGGIINSLRVALAREKKIQEEEFIASISGFLNHEI